MKNNEKTFETILNIVKVFSFALWLTLGILKTNAVIDMSWGWVAFWGFSPAILMLALGAIIFLICGVMAVAERVIR